MTGAELEALSWKQGQAVDALCLLLDGLEREGKEVTKGPAAAECFANRLRVYMGAFHLITDTLEATGGALENMAQQMDTGGGEQHG